MLKTKNAQGRLKTKHQYLNRPANRYLLLRRFLFIVMTRSHLVLLLHSTKRWLHDNQCMPTPCRSSQGIFTQNYKAYILAFPLNSITYIFETYYQEIVIYESVVTANDYLQRVNQLDWLRGYHSRPHLHRGRAMSITTLTVPGARKWTIREELHVYSQLDRPPDSCVDAGRFVRWWGDSQPGQ